MKKKKKSDARSLQIPYQIRQEYKNIEPLPCIQYFWESLTIGPPLNSVVPSAGSNIITGHKRKLQCTTEDHASNTFGSVSDSEVSSAKLALQENDDAVQAAGHISIIFYLFADGALLVLKVAT